MAFDILIRNGQVVDGTGSAPRRADVGIDGERIAAVGELAEAEGRQELDAGGRLVTPGFIDVHAHSDVSRYLNPVCETQVGQGITTEVMGNCGYSPFPLMANNRGLLLDPPGVEVPWSTAVEYFRVAGDRGAGINGVPQVGHLTLRKAVLDGEDRPATSAEIGQMKGHVRDAMEAGARGLSSGLDYEPTTASDLDEVVDLVKVAVEYGGFYSSHIRGYSWNVLNAVAETLEVGRRTGATIQISHLHIYGRKHWGWMHRVLDLMDRAREDGVKVACDMMPYPTSGAWWSPRAILPPEVYNWKKTWAENLPELAALLRNPRKRAELKAEIEVRRTQPKRGFHEEFSIFGDWRDIHIVELPAASPRHELVGLDMAAAAEVVGQDPCDLYFDMILEEGEEFGAICSPFDEQDLRALMSDQWTLFGTDAVGSSVARLTEPWNTIQPHRRHTGTFPRVLAKFVRDEGLLEIGGAIRRMSGLAADHLGLEGRGYIREGGQADLVVADLEGVDERGTWRLPSAYPIGIDEVFVNGVQAVAEGEFTGKLAGRILTRPGS